MQISYHSILTKIQKLQNLKKKKKKFYFYWLVLPEIGRYDRYFFLVRNRRVICTGLLVGTVYFSSTGLYGMELTPLSNSDNKTLTQQILGKSREELQGVELYIYIYIFMN